MFETIYSIVLVITGLLFVYFWWWCYYI